MISLHDPIRIVLLEHFRQRLKAAVVEIFLDALRVDHAVVPQGHAALPVEKDDVAVKLEEFSPHGLAGHFEMPDRMAVVSDDRG